MKLRFTIKTCLALTFLVACYCAWLATVTDAVSAELAQIVFPLGSDKPLENLDQFYSGLLRRLDDCGIDRFQKSRNPNDDLRRTVKVEVMEPTDKTVNVLVEIVETIHSPRGAECSHILDAAIAELRAQLPPDTLYRTLNRRN